MPIYEYEHQGKACSLGKVFEHWQSIKDKPLDNCPECGIPVKRLISGASINLRKARGQGLKRGRNRGKGKGSGFNLIGDRKKPG